MIQKITKRQRTLNYSYYLTPERTFKSIKLVIGVRRGWSHGEVGVGVGSKGFGEDGVGFGGVQVRGLGSGRSEELGVWVEGVGGVWVEGRVGTGEVGGLGSRHWGRVDWGQGLGWKGWSQGGWGVRVGGIGVS